MATEISVASQVYNMAGDEADRPNYLKTVVFQSILSNKKKKSLSEDITKSHLNGPGVSLRGFFRWADANYNQIGVPTGTLAGYTTIDNSVVQANIPGYTSDQVNVILVTYAPADYMQFARQWMLDNHYAEADLNYSVNVNDTTGEVTITMSSTTVYTFTLVGYSVGSTYLYIEHQTRDTELDPWSNTKMYIYRIGSGNAALDAAVTPLDSYGKFFPMIPIRLFNKFISESYYPLQYPLGVKATKKATGGSFNDLVAQISTNESLPDIDHAYIIFGVSLNVKEDACKKYMFKFFEKLQSSQIRGRGILTNRLCVAAGAFTFTSAFNLWSANVNNPASNLYGVPPPEADKFTTSSISSSLLNTIRVNDNTAFDFRITWTYIHSAEGVGTGKVGAKVGELWFSALSADPQTGKTRIRLYWQYESAKYRYLDIIGMEHYNYVYGGKYVRHRALDVVLSISSAEEKESGFIIPLHYGTYVDMSIIDYTQMSTACVFLVFNAYVTRNVPWWETTIFRIILIVVIAVVSVVFTGGAGLGLLGTNLALGTTLGFTGLTAAIVGSVVNALAAVALSTIITSAAQAVFGEEIGAIIGTVVSFFLMQGIQSFSTTGTFGFDFTQLMKVDTLMTLMDAVSQGYTAIVNGNIRALQTELNQYITDTENQIDELNDKLIDEFGDGSSYVDPMLFTSATQRIIESGDTFLTRTLMTGSDIADMSNSLVNDYCDMLLTLPNAYR